MLSIDICRSSRGRMPRREFLQVGTLGLGGLSLADLLRAQANAAGTVSEKGFVRDKSVVFLYLAGGASQYETFDPKPDNSGDFTSIAGHIGTQLPGVRFASYFPQLAARADRLTVLRSLVSKTANHAKAVKNMLTGGLEDPNGREGAPAIHPSLGALYAQARGVTDRRTGMPSYAFIPPVFSPVEGLKISSVNPGVESCILGSGGGSLGAAYAPFNPESTSGWRELVTPQLPEARLDARRNLLDELDRFDLLFETHAAFRSLDELNQQAFDALRGGAIRTALDLSLEDSHTLARYDTTHCPIYGWNKANYWERSGPSTGFPLGKQMLLARRLCEAGCRFVTVVHSNWDMHGGEAIWGMKDGMEIYAPPLDHAVAAFLDDLAERGLDRDILLVVTGEFGRSSGINKVGGREHNSGACSVLFAGGGLHHGQVIGRTNSRGSSASHEVVTVDDLCATLMHYLFDIGSLRVARTATGPLQSVALDHGTPVSALF